MIFDYETAAARRGAPRSLLVPNASSYTTAQLVKILGAPIPPHFAAAATPESRRNAFAAETLSSPPDSNSRLKSPREGVEGGL